MTEASGQEDGRLTVREHAAYKLLWCLPRNSVFTYLEVALEAADAVLESFTTDVSALTEMTGLPKNHPASVLIAYQQARIAELESRNTP